MWLKADLHLHTNEGPEEFVPWTPEELIDRAATAGFQVLSFTDHDMVTYSPGLARYARDRGILLIPGLEATVEGRHVLLYNFRCPPERLRNFSAIRSLRRPDNLVVAPHPFFPGPTSLRRRLSENLDLFDAIEYSHFYTEWINWNRKGMLVAQRNGLPLLGGSDAHLPRQLGTTYSLISSEPQVERVLDAIRTGRVRVVSRPLQPHALFAIALSLMGGATLQAGWGPFEVIRHALWVTRNAVRQSFTTNPSKPSSRMRIPEMPDPSITPPE